MIEMEQAQQRIGTTLRDKWTLERLLGVGGMAAVYVGVHKIGRRDAIKVLHREAAASKELSHRFEREARAANGFQHPGAVQIHDIDVAEDGAPFLVMELLIGESLSDRARRVGRIEPSTLLAYMDQVLDVLVAAHARGIVHRDIKPDNLFVLDEGRVKVLDFGIARIRQGPDLDSTWTRLGLTLGTTSYMPPEQARGRSIDARADLFAVGATMFRLLTGRRIHEATTDHELLLKMAREPAPSLCDVAPELPRGLIQVVDRALAFEREARYASAAQMAEDVRSLLRGEAPSHAAAPRSAPATVALPRPRAGAAPLDDVRSAARESSDEISVVWSAAPSTLTGLKTPHEPESADTDRDERSAPASPAAPTGRQAPEHTLASEVPGVAEPASPR